MINFVQYTEKYISKIIELWNNQIGFIYNIDKKVFDNNITFCPYFLESASFLALDEEEVVGFILSKKYDNNEIISKYIDVGWISLFYVSSYSRRKGIGSILLEKAEEIFKKNKIIKIQVGSDINNFFPGIPVDFNNLTTNFFQKRNYTLSYSTHDVIKSLNEIDLIINKEFDYLFVRKSEPKFELVIEFMKNNFYGRWYQDILDIKDNYNTTYVVAIFKNEVIGFLRINFPDEHTFGYNINFRNNFEKLVGIGPLGVSKNYRKLNIARSLINLALDKTYKLGYKTCLIDWTGLLEFYQKFGFSVWKSYAYCFKNI